MSMINSITLMSKEKKAALIRKAAVSSGIFLLAISFFGTGYYLYAKSSKKPTIYLTEAPFKTAIIKKTVATGSIVPRMEVAIKSQVSGVVDQLFVEPGDHVKSGDVLAKIRLIPDVVQLNNAQTSLKTAMINLDNSRREYERKKALFESKLISSTEYNSALLDFELKQQSVESAESNLALIKEGASKKSGTVSNIIRSTIDGMVLDTPVKEGSFITETNTFNAGTTIVSVANMNEMIFQGKVDESEVGKLVVGMPLDMQVGALERESFRADLEYISPKGIEEEGAIKFEIRAAVKLKDNVFLRAGYSSNADIILDRRENVLAINESNLIFKRGKAHVEVETAEQVFELREIKTGLSDGINIEIISGLSESDKVKKPVTAEPEQKRGEGRQGQGRRGGA